MMKLVICLCSLLVITHGAPADDGNIVSNLGSKIKGNVGRLLDNAATNVLGCSSGIYKNKF